MGVSSDLGRGQWRLGGITNEVEHQRGDGKHEEKGRKGGAKILGPIEEQPGDDRAGRAARVSRRLAGA